MGIFEEVLTLANEAKDYARSRIAKGTAQLENNALSILYLDYLSEGLKESRAIIANLAKRNLLEHQAVALYESKVAVTAKYSLGNCDELATQALDYVLHNNRRMFAEMYRIKGGDHVFLVINKAANSDPANPASWGEAAIICDPWANKVYPASEYKTELKNFYKKERKNFVEDFNAKRHQLVPMPDFNTTFLRKQRTVENLRQNFSKVANHMMISLFMFKNDLKKEVHRLAKKYHPEHPKVILLAKKIQEIDRLISGCSKYAKEARATDSKDDYQEAKKHLHEALVDMCETVRRAVSFSQEALATLYDIQGSATHKQVMKFFGAKSRTEKNLTSITEKVNRALRRRPRHK